MKKILLLISAIIFLPLCSLAVEEIYLPEKKMDLDYLSNVYYGRIENDEDVSPILKLFSQKGLVFENSKINSVKADFVYASNLYFSGTKHQKSHFVHDFGIIEPIISINFNENKSKFMFDYNLARSIEGYSNGFTQRISQLYISHKINENQMILLGQGRRIPNSYDGSRNTMEQELVLKSQLGRTFGDVRAAGIRNTASYKYIDYDIGLYDSTRYMKKFGNGLDFTGHAIFKPFADSNEILSTFKTGAGYNIGSNGNSYKMYSVFASYDYKNFHLRAEYANADGYNGIYQSADNADGFYTLFSYNITPKLSVLGRYDYFVQDGSSNRSYNREYTAGLTYNPFKNIKFMLNYVKRNYSYKADSDMILFATRFII